jgi:UDP-N-acetylmuramoyl-L-alanyl-D-glutamate--2,6-diaminopimelate ligase
LQLLDLLKNVPVLEVQGDLSGEIFSVCYDSKNCGRNSLFVAVPGLKLDGHQFIAEAIERGAAAVVHEKDAAPVNDAVFIKVKDCRRVLGLLGKNFYGNPSRHLCLIGITGTNGKTTVTYLIESILQTAGLRTGVIGTINYRFDGRVRPAQHTTPESYELQKVLREMLDAGVSHVVMEVSSHSLDLRRVDDCEFDLGVFLNLSQDHLDYHRTLEEYFLAKKRFFNEILKEGAKNRPLKMIVNGDDLWGRSIIEDAGASRVLTFGIDSTADIGADHIRLSLKKIHADIKTPSGHFALSASLIGRFNLYNILAAVSAAYSLGIGQDAIRRGILHAEAAPGRLQKVSEKGQPTVFVDFAHTDDALRRVLENLGRFRKGRIITVFGCGGDRDRGKRPLMGAAASSLSDLTVLTSDNPRTEDPVEILRQIEKGVDRTKLFKYRPDDLDRNFDQKGYVVVPDRREAIQLAVAVAAKEDIVLIAGKGHENYQIIKDKKIPFDDREVTKEVLKILWPERKT